MQNLSLSDNQNSDTKGDTKEYLNLSQETANCDKSEDNKLKDNMEEKELNLCELLKGCEGEKFYCPFYGSIIFKEINNNNVIICNTDNREVNANFWPSGVAYYTKGSISLFPSLELYEKYPLDAYSAWMEWQESKKKIIQLFFDMKVAEKDSDELLLFEYVLYEFNSCEEAQQAIEVVKEALQKFHENNIKK